MLVPDRLMTSLALIMGYRGFCGTIPHHIRPARAPDPGFRLLQPKEHETLNPSSDKGDCRAILKLGLDPIS
jgi:hypothetical protein